MSLRQARFDDHWRRAFKRSHPTRLTQIRFQGLRGFTDGTINFSGGINAVVGLNGVGKSTLGAAIAELLPTDPNPNEEAYANRLKGSTIEGVAFLEDHELQLKADDDSDGNRRVDESFTGESRWLDPSFLGGRILYHIHRDLNFNDLLDPLTPLDLGESELRIASYLVGKKYDKVAIYEISDYGDLDRFPYFRVTSDGIEYSTEAMGRGELSVLLTYWTLRDLSKHSILVLEEPETHVSPRSQDCLMNIIAKFCDEMGIWVIAITHSPTVIRRIPPEHIKVLTRVGPSVTCAAEAKKVDIALMLGGGVGYSGVVLVEDNAARDFLLVILEVLDRELLRQFEILVSGSDTNITGILKMMPSTNRFTLMGAYDGDLRGSINPEGFRWPHSFLPGTQAPEEVLIDFLGRRENAVDDLVSSLQRTAVEVRIALNTGDGTDLHDYFTVVAAALTIDVAIVRRTVSRMWLSEEANRTAASILVNEIRQAPRWTSV